MDNVRLQSSLFGHPRSGRLGNIFFQYLTYKILEIKFGRKVHLPPCEADGIFLFDQSEIQPAEIVYDLELAYSRSLPISSLLSLIDRLEARAGCIDIAGSFQFDTRFYAPYRDVIDSVTYTEGFRSLMDNLRAITGRAPTLTVHVRRGDYLELSKHHPYFWPPNEGALARTIKILKNEFPTLTCYLATDDDCYTLPGFIKSGNIHELLDLGATAIQIDFAMLLISNFIIVSNSSFSVSASLLNRGALACFRQESPTLAFKRFYPENTSVAFCQ